MVATMVGAVMIKPLTVPQAKRLAREARARPTNRVRVSDLDRALTTWRYYCPVHREVNLRAGLRYASVHTIEVSQGAYRLRGQQDVTAAEVDAAFIAHLTGELAECEALAG